MSASTTRVVSGIQWWRALPIGNRLGAVRSWNAIVSRVVLAVALALALTLMGCSRAPPDATPEGAVHLFLERMDSAATGAVPMSDVYALLGPSTRKNLADRASRAGKIQGRRIDASDMLAPGRYALKFRPKSMTSRTSGDTAVVTVVGYEASETAEVTLVRENGAYKVELDLPDVTPLPQRGDGGLR